MNWTSRNPIENVKCIVETNSGCVFPAHCINGSWWNTEKGFPVEDVKRWIVYPEGEEPNDLVAPEVLLKYAYKDYKKEQNFRKLIEAKFTEIRKLNKELTSQYNKIYKECNELKAQLIQQKNDLLQENSEELYQLRQLNKTLVETCKDLKLKAENAKNEETKRLQKEVGRLKGYLKSIGYIYSVVMNLENEKAETETKEE